MKATFVVAAAAAALLSACGGDGGSVTTAPPAQASNAMVQVNLGDGPADNLVAVQTIVNAVTLTTPGGGSVTVMATPRPMEMMQLMGTVAPLALANVPQGTYSGATMMFGPATVTYVDAATGQIMQKTTPGPVSATVTFSPVLTIGTAPAVINFDMNMAASVAIDSAGNVAMTPMLTARMNPMVTASRDPEDGGMHGLMAMVGAIDGSRFTLSTMQGLTGMSLMANAATQFGGVTGMGMMSGSMLVSVDAMPQPDGTWVASHVQSRMDAGGAMAGGIVTGITGNPPTQLTLVMRNGLGGGMMPSDLAGPSTVTLDDHTQFSIDADGVDLGGLPFTPMFDRAHLARGQGIDTWSGGQMTHHGGMGGMFGPMMTSGTALAAASVQLEPQGLRGTVSGYTSNGARSSFTLTMPADSAFAKLTGASAVTVYQQGGTTLRGLTAITDGSNVQVRGLLFLDGGVYRLVAGRIVAG
jgi:hypothetical protein